MRQNHNENEIDVLNRCLKGSSDSFAVIVGRYQSLVCGITFASTGNFGKSEELAQETFVLAWKNLRQLRDLSRFKPWLCQITRNVIQNWRRTARRDVIQHAIPLGTTSEPTTLKAEPSGLAIREEEQAVIDQAIEAMPEKYRLPLILFYREDKSSREVAQLIGLSENTTRQQIARARAMLKDQVAKMVETSLAQTKPGKVFTGAVLASIAGVTMKGTAISAAATGGWTLWAGFSGLAGKITTVAAGLAILAGVTYTINEQKTSEPFKASSQPSAAVDQQTQQPILEDDQNTNIAISVPALELDQPDANSQVFLAPEIENTALSLATADPCANDASVSDNTGESIRLQCVDETGGPVSGALVYVLQMSHQGPPLVWGFDQNPSHQSDGPLTSDPNGFIEFQTFEGPGDRDVYRMGYGVLPHQRVGIWSQFVRANGSPAEPNFTLVLRASRTVSGQASIPPGYDIESVHVDTMLISVPTRDRPYGDSFQIWMLEDMGVFPGLFDVPVDAAGRFEVSDLPTNGRFNVRARASGLGEEQMHVLDAQRVDFIELGLSPHGIIEGSVRFADTHAPAAFRKVFCRTFSNKGIARSHIGTTNDSGYYRIEGLSAGTYEVVVGMDAFPPSHVARARDDVEVKSDFVAGSVGFELETGAVITGIMTNRDTGAPIQGIQVAALSSAGSRGVCINTAFSDEQGLYSLRLPIGDSELYMGAVPKGTLYPENQGKRIVSVISTAQVLDPVNFALGSDATDYDDVGKGTVSGRVFDQDGIPISNVAITGGREYKQGEDTRQVGGEKLGRTDEDGRFNVQVQAMDKHQIFIGGYEWSVHISEWFQIEKGETKDLGDTYLEPYVLKMSAQVLDEEGHAIPHVTYAVSAEAYYNPNGWMSTDSKGMIFLENLPDSEITLLLPRDGFQRQDWKGFAGDHVEIILKKE
jgi:RNA polymerase sigma factor (sigma-70 family)